MKFINLLKKELSELINIQMLLSLVLTMGIFMILGNVMKSSIDEAIDSTKNVTINISDRDQTDFTKAIEQALLDINDDPDENTNVKLKYFDTTGDDYAKILEDNDINNIVIIPEGFTKKVEADERPNIISVNRMESAATLSNISDGNSSAISLIRDCISSSIASEYNISEEKYDLLEYPVDVTDNTVIDDKSAEISSGSIMAKISIQNMILPIIVFVLIIFTSQMLMNAIANEKIDKTLETLLSAPVSRLAIIGSKMLAAAIIALINAAVFMFGFSFFVSDSTTEVTETAKSAVEGSISMDEAFRQLGISLSTGDYILVGLQLFFTILICLSASLILGALVDDPKKTQNMLMPIMMLAIVPYMISMLADINTLPTPVKLVVYAIPFTHTFTSIPNLMFGHTTLFIFGLIYQILFFIVCIFFALRIFMTDRIFTISLNFGQKNKYKKKKKGAAASDEE
ncbi:MAG: ABC transporter permease [Ruminococcus sp.]|nr:ABC transporter permease [Ruminococcus sp.]MBR6984022.1 ABC transporter permease [Ruminococcus sp.]